MSEELRILKEKVELESQDIVEVEIHLKKDQIVFLELKSIACSEMQAQLKIFENDLKKISSESSKTLEGLAEIKGTTHSQMLLRELILKLKSQWNPPYKEEELCHCRQISTQKVDQSILRGCHSVSQISEKTSAGTSCGTCRPDIEKLLNYRLGKE